MSADVFVQIGDTVHVADPSSTPATAVPAPAPTIAELLAQSRAAHQRFQRASGHNDGRGTIIQPDDDAALLAIQEALFTREAAEAVDTLHSDSAWADDQAANKGVTSAAMLAFFHDYLTP